MPRFGEFFENPIFFVGDNPVQSAGAHLVFLYVEQL